MRYYNIDGKAYPSVTTILGNTKSPKAAKSLSNWYKRLGKEEAERLSQNALLRGKFFHSLCEAYQLGEIFDYNPEELNDAARDALDMFTGAQRVLDKITAVIGIEQQIYHSRLGYAGTYDSFATFNGVERTLIDFKGSSRPKSEAWIQDYFIQTAAYAGAIYNQFGIRVEQTAVVVGLVGAEAQVFTMNRPAISYYWNLWLERLDQFYALHPEMPPEAVSLVS